MNGSDPSRTTPRPVRHLTGLAPPSGKSTGPGSSNELYHPSVFRYTCRGRVSLDSRNGGKSPYSAGICRGFQSQLEHMDQWRKMSRDDAIQVFQAKSAASYSDGENAPNPATALPPMGPESASPTGGDTANAQALQAVYLSNVLVYPNSENEDEKNQKNNNKNIVMKNNRTNVTTVTPEQEEWKCYGTTEVDLLVLRPDAKVNPDETIPSDQQTDDEEIAAVAPLTAPGVAVRDLTTNAFGKERTRTIRLGILEIVYSTGMDLDDDDDVEDHEDVVNRAQTPAGKTPKKHKPRDGDTNEQEDNEKDRLSTPKKIYRAGVKVATHMEHNAKLLYESTQDDFPNRTYEAGKKIYNEFGSTITRTTNMMKKMANFFADDDDDDEEEHGPNRK